MKQVPLPRLVASVRFEGMTLKDQVEEILPNWQRWYPSLFDAATDLGVLRARVCSPDSLLLSKRHQRIVNSAEAAHRKQWGAEDGPRHR